MTSAPSISTTTPPRVGRVHTVHATVVPTWWRTPRFTGAPGHALAAALMTGATSAVAVVLASAGAAPAATYVYPLLAVALAAVLLRGHPERYAAFAWWTWVVAPWVRRVVDLYGGWNPLSPLTLTPLIVSGLAVFPLLRRAPRLRRRALAPFTLAGAAVLSGFAVGFTRVGPAGAFYGLLSWGAPLAFGAWLTMEWRRYPALRDVILRTLALATFAVAAYGIYQFLSPPAWDRSWMLNSAMESIGRPEPFQVRVFSTLNSPGTLAGVLCTTLLLLLTAGVPRSVISVAAGCGALLLTLGRAAWIGTLVGLLVLASQTSRVVLTRQLRVAAQLLAAATLSVAAASAFLPADVRARATDVVARRVNSTTALDQDASFFDRQRILERSLERVEAQPLGHGIGASGGGVGRLSGPDVIEAFDNGLLEVVYALGWPGAAAFYGAILWIAFARFRGGTAADDTTPAAARAVLAAAGVQLLAGNQFTGAVGAAFWSTAGLLSAARVWHAAIAARQPGAPTIAAGSAITDARLAEARV